MRLTLPSSTNRITNSFAHILLSQSIAKSIVTSPNHISRLCRKRWRRLVRAPFTRTIFLLQKQIQYHFSNKFLNLIFIALRPPYSCGLNKIAQVELLVRYWLMVHTNSRRDSLASNIQFEEENCERHRNVPAPPPTVKMFEFETEHDNYTNTDSSAAKRRSPMKKKTHYFHRQIQFQNKYCRDTDATRNGEKKWEREKRFIVCCSIWYAGQKHLTSHDFMFIVCGARRQLIAVRQRERARNWLSQFLFFPY